MIFIFLILFFSIYLTFLYFYLFIIAFIRLNTLSLTALTPPIIVAFLILDSFVYFSIGSGRESPLTNSTGASFVPAQFPAISASGKSSPVAYTPSFDSGYDSFASFADVSYLSSPPILLTAFAPSYTFESFLLFFSISNPDFNCFSTSFDTASSRPPIFMFSISHSANACFVYLGTESYLVSNIGA